MTTDKRVKKTESLSLLPYVETITNLKTVLPSKRGHVTTEEERGSRKAVPHFLLQVCEGSG